MAVEAIKRKREREKASLKACACKVKAGMSGQSWLGHYMRRAAYYSSQLLVHTAFFIGVVVFVWMAAVYVIPTFMWLIVEDVKITGDVSSLILAMALGFPLLFLTSMTVIGCSVAIRWAYRRVSGMMSRFKIRMLGDRQSKGE